jgi:DUF3072 family protein
MVVNPKNVPSDNKQKHPDDRVPGDEPMTGVQASYLKTLAEQAHEPAAYNDNLTMAQASKEIDRLKGKRRPGRTRRVS